MTQSDSWLVTLDPNSPDGFNIFNKNIINNFSFKSRNINTLTKEPTENEEWDGFKIPNYSLNSLAQLLEYNTWHKKCCDAVATDGMGTQWNITQKQDLLKQHPDKTQKEELTVFVQNLTQNIHTIFHDLVYDRRALGCAALEIIRDPYDKKHKPIDLHPLTVTDLHLHYDNCRIKQTLGTKEVWFVEYGKNFDETGIQYDVDCRTGKKVPKGSLPYEYTANEVIWFREYAPCNKNYGLPNTIPALNAIYGDLGRAEYNNKFFENYGLPAFAVTITGDFQDYDVPKYLEDGSLNPDYHVEETLKYKISQQIKEVIRNPHSAVTITVPSISEDSNVEVKIQPLSVDQKESSFVIFRSDNREEVCAAHGVPLYRLGISIEGKLSGTSASESSNIYADSVVQPIRTDNENIINTLAFNEFGVTDYVFKLDVYRKKDEEKELSMGTTLFEHGALTLGEYISYFGKQFGAKLQENSPLMDCRMIGNQLIDEDGVPFIQTGNNTNPSWLDGLENNLVNEAKNMEDEDEDIKTTIKQEDKNHINGLKNSSNKTDSHRITKTIRRAFNNRK